MREVRCEDNLMIMWIALVRAAIWSDWVEEVGINITSSRFTCCGSFKSAALIFHRENLARREIESEKLFDNVWAGSRLACDPRLESEIPFRRFVYAEKSRYEENVEIRRNNWTRSQVQVALLLKWNLKTRWMRFLVYSTLKKFPVDKAIKSDNWDAIEQWQSFPNFQCCWHSMNYLNLIDLEQATELDA